MNKFNNLIVTVISILSIVLNVINGEERVFLNFVPFSTESCQGNPSGIGYGAIVNTCFTLDYNVNWVFKVSSKGKGEVSWTGFESEYGTEECNSVTNKTVQHNVGDCISGADISFDSSYFQAKRGGNEKRQHIKFDKSPSSISIYYKLLVTVNQPYIPESSIVNLYMYNECELLDYSVLVEYFTNSTTVGYAIKGDTKTFQCVDNIPYSVTCIDGQCDPPTLERVECSANQPPFFNSSSEHNPPSSTGGPWTDHATSFVANHDFAPATGGSGTASSGSGTGSGSNSAAASSSGSNSGVVSGTGHSTDASYGSSTSHINFISTYCS